MSIPYLYQEIEQIYAKTIGKGARTLTVTSSVTEEGTSSIVCALAQRARAVDFKVLVVDLNLHNPCVSNLVEQSADVSDPWDPDVQSLALTAQIKDGPNFPVIPVPDSADNQICLREQTMLKRMVDHWLQDYDLIIFDTSPLCLVNRRNVPPQLVATCCDGAIIVIQANKTNTSQLAEAMAILKSVNVNLLGTVINDHTNPPLGTELIRQCLKLKKWFPTVADWLAGHLSASKFFFARF